MNSVQLATLYLNHSPAAVQKISKLLESAEIMHGFDTPEFYDYIDQYSLPSEQVIVEASLSDRLEETSKEYMGVTVYHNEDGTYSAPELGVYNIDGARQLKIAVKTKMSQTTRTNIKENINFVIDQLFDNYNLSESRFFEYVLEQMTESQYEELGGINFKSFVMTIGEIVGEHEPQSMINESYIFDEGFGDFVKKVKNGVSDAHLNLSYAAPGLAASLGNAHQRHSDAVYASKKKIKNAVGTVFNKDNIKMGARIAHATVNAASSGFNKSVAAVADNATAGAKAAVALSDKGSRKGDGTIKDASNSTESLKSDTYRNKSNAANDVLDKLRTDADAEKAPSPKAKKKPTAKELEAKYDEVMKEEDDNQELELIRLWLSENDIFDIIEDIDDYILNEMTTEEYATILAEVSKSVQSVTNRNDKRDAKHQKRKDAEQNYRNSTSDISDRADDLARVPYDRANNAFKFKRSTNSKDSMEALRNSNNAVYSVYTANKQPTQAKPLGRAIAPPSNAVVPVSKAYNKPLGRAIAPPSNAVVPVSKAYNKPLGRAIAPPTQAKPLGKAIGDPHSTAMRNAMLAMHEPALKDKPYDHTGGYGAGMVAVRGNTSSTNATMGASNRLRGVMDKNKVKPSGLVDTVSRAAKGLGSRLVTGIKNRMMNESLVESDIKNYITEDEFTVIAEWLLENEIFDTEEDTEHYLMYELNWSDLEAINEQIEDKAFDIICQSLISEHTMVDTYMVLENLFGDEFTDIFEDLEDSGIDSKPMPIKKSSKKDWKNTVYNKMRGV
jgi:hypothetical protein